MDLVLPVESDALTARSKSQRCALQGGAIQLCGDSAVNARAGVELDHILLQIAALRDDRMQQAPRCIAGGVHLDPEHFTGTQQFTSRIPASLRIRELKAFAYPGGAVAIGTLLTGFELRIHDAHAEGLDGLTARAVDHAPCKESGALGDEQQVLAIDGGHRLHQAHDFEAIEFDVEMIGRQALQAKTALVIGPEAWTEVLVLKLRADGDAAERRARRVLKGSCKEVRLAEHDRDVRHTREIRGHLEHALVRGEANPLDPQGLGARARCAEFEAPILIGYGVASVVGTGR